MMFNTQLLLSFLVWMTSATGTHAQTSDVNKLFHDLELKASSGTKGTDEAEPVLERLGQASRESIVRDLPVILHEARSAHDSVRGVAATALFAITMRPDGRALLSAETTTFTALLIDTNIPIRRMAGLTINNLHLKANSPLVPALEVYLGRQDAVSTIGAGVAGLLMQAAPSRADSISAVVRFMRRQDQTSRSRLDTLQSIRVAGSHNREIGKEVTAYADDVDEQTSIDALKTLQDMGKSVVLDNQLDLSQIAADSSKSTKVRDAATKALSVAQQ